MNTVIEQHHETINSAVEKPGASQNPPGNNSETTIYDTPSRHVCYVLLRFAFKTSLDAVKLSSTCLFVGLCLPQPRVCQVNSVTVMIENQEQQPSGHDRTVKVRATVHKAEEPDSEQINTVYCKLGEI